MLKFDWDAPKSTAHLRKHGVSFSIREARFITIGQSHQDLLLVVAHIEHGRTIRIISARKATRHERTIYEQN